MFAIAQQEYNRTNKTENQPAVFALYASEGHLYSIIT